MVTPHSNLMVIHKAQRGTMVKHLLILQSAKQNREGMREGEKHITYCYPTFKFDGHSQGSAGYH